MTNPHHVRNLIRQAKPAPGSKKWGLIRLLVWQPYAKHIQFESGCPCCKRRQGFQISFQLPGDSPRKNERESCGWYCPFCGFSNAGTRPIRPSRKGKPVL